jgi:hypothetical protein
VGCGGGGESAEETEAPPASETPAAAVSPEAVEPSLSPQPEQVFEPFPTDEAVLLEDVAARLESGQPMIVFFYDEAQPTTGFQKSAVETVLEDYRGLIDQVSFNVGKYVTVDEDGAITIKPEMAEDETARKVANLMGSDYLAVTFTPYLVIVDEQGYITHRFRGPVDAESLEREVLRATQ